MAALPSIFPEFLLVVPVAQLNSKEEKDFPTTITCLSLSRILPDSSVNLVEALRYIRSTCTSLSNTTANYVVPAAKVGETESTDQKTNDTALDLDPNSLDSC